MINAYQCGHRNFNYLLTNLSDNSEGVSQDKSEALKIYVGLGLGLGLYNFRLGFNNFIIRSLIDDSWRMHRTIL